MKIRYAALDDDPDAETTFSMVTIYSCVEDRDLAATDCAEDYVAKHDGGEDWPAGQSSAFALFTEAGQPLGVYDVTMELTPSYHAVSR